MAEIEVTDSSSTSMVAIIAIIVIVLIALFFVFRNNIFPQPQPQPNPPGVNIQLPPIGGSQNPTPSNPNTPNTY